MKNRSIAFIIPFLAVSILIMQMALISADTMQQISYNVSTTQAPISGANFMVTMLKYEPFPVNAGDSFDLWIKVQNIGQADATNARFELAPEYPFTSTDSLVRDYGLINGLSSAYTIDQKIDSTQVVLKFRVNVADNSPTGTQTLKFYSMTNSKDSSSAKIETDIPIDIAKTKTDFDVKLKDLSPSESSFVVSNIGQNDAKAVRVDVKKTDGVVILSGEEPASLGDLSQGEFTVAHIAAVPNPSSKDRTMTVQVSYTDTSGVRSTVEKTVSVDESLVQTICTQTSASDYMRWLYGIIGLVTGAFIVLLIWMLRNKKKSETHQHSSHVSR